MRFLTTTTTTTTTLLLFTLLLATCIAKPIPASLAEIERRWSKGESEVCLCQSNMPACYIHAWLKSLARRGPRPHEAATTR